MASSSTVRSSEIELAESTGTREAGYSEHYPYPSHVNAASFVSIKLSSEDNYDVWQEQMTCLVKCHGMLGFINGTAESPMEDGELHEEWERADMLVKGWIFGSLSEDAMETVVGLDTAYDVWEKLKTTYSTPAAARGNGYPKHYPYPSHVNAASFVSIKLSSEDNYDVWQEQMMCLVKCHGMLGFINGTAESPMEDVELHEEWERADMLVKGWIFGSLSEHVMKTVVGLQTANHVWEQLKTTYTTPASPTTSITEKDPAEYLPLHRAIVTNDWETAKAILKDDKDAFTAIIADDTGYRAIHLALNKDDGLDFLKNLLEGINPDVLPTLLSIDKLTPLHLAADSGNKFAAEMLVYKNPYLLFILDKNDLLPIHRAVINSHRTTSQYLLDACQQHIHLISPQDGYHSPFEGRNGAMLLTYAIHSEFLDICNDLIIKYPHMARTKCQGAYPLEAIAAMRDSYYRGTRYSYYQKIVYSCLPIDFNLLCDTNNIQDIENQNTRNANLTIKGFLYSVIQRINVTYNAVIQRINVKFWNVMVTYALQMQRELQWFQEVQNFGIPQYMEQKNKAGDTPIMVFRKEHEKLRKEGEEWMKKTADSFTITAALIITIVFAAAITVPGGNDDNSGKPIYTTKLSFIIFAVSDAISLFTSTTSLLLFLSILTTRFQDEDFLYSLPKRLILGLVMLFLSVTSMMVAFSATLYLMFGQEKAWILIPIATLACLPIVSFVTLQLPLLVDMISSTYGRGIFAKKSNRKLKQS